MFTRRSQDRVPVLQSGSTSALGHTYGVDDTSTPRSSGAADVVDPPENSISTTAWWWWWRNPRTGLRLCAELRRRWRGRKRSGGVRLGFVPWVGQPPALPFIGGWAAALAPPPSWWGGWARGRGGWASHPSNPNGPSSPLLFSFLIWPPFLGLAGWALEAVVPWPM